MLVHSTNPSTWRYERNVSATHDWILKELTEEAKSFLFMFALLDPDDMSGAGLLAKHARKDMAFLSDQSK